MILKENKKFRKMFKVADLVSFSVYQSNCRETKSTAFDDTFIPFYQDLH